MVVAVAPASFLAKIYSCEEMSHRLLFYDEQKVWDRVKMQAHLMICQGCVNYKEQMETIDASLSSPVESQSGLSSQKLSDLEQKIIQQNSSN